MNPKHVEPRRELLPRAKVVWEVMWQWVGKGMQLVTVAGVLLLNINQGEYVMLGLVGVVGLGAVVIALWDFTHLYGKCQDVSLMKAPSWQEMRSDIKTIKGLLNENK